MDQRSSCPPFPRGDEFDPSQVLALQLAALRELHALDELVIADLDGTPLASAGDQDTVRALSAFAAAMLRGAPAGTAQTFHCGKVHVELIAFRGRLCALAAKAPFLVLEPEALAATLADAVLGFEATQTVRPLPLGFS